MQRQDIHKGMKVRGSDGASLGKVVEIGDQTFLIEKGFFFPKDFYARYDMVTDIRDSEIWLSESGEILKGRMSRGEYEKDTGKAPWVSSEEHRIPLSEEQLIAEKRAREVGEVRVHKEVTTEQKQVAVPVTKEQVKVERVPASGEVRAGEATFKEQQVSIPVTEEEVEIRKRPVVKEEVRVSKGARQEVRTLGAETRSEEAKVETKGDVTRDENENLNK